MSQLLAVLPPYLPSSCPGSVNKTSRRNLFSKSKINSDGSESCAKRLRKDSEGGSHSVQADSENCVNVNQQTAAQGNPLGVVNMLAKSY